MKLKTFLYHDIKIFDLPKTRAKVSLKKNGEKTSELTLQGLQTNYNAVT
jgi:hypothetical protein